MAYSQSEQLTKLKIMLEGGDIPSDEMLDLYLDEARDFINLRRKFTPTDEIPLEDKYLSLQIKMAKYSVLKMGAEGQTEHTENDVKRVYENGSDYPYSLVAQIIPLAKA